MAASNSIDLSIIIPAYKEADIIGDKLQELAKFLKDNKDTLGSVEVLVVSNCPEATAQEAIKQINHFDNLRVVDESQRLGKGGAVRLGMFEAKGKYRMFMDTDLSTPLKHVPELVGALNDGADLAIGVRDLVKIHKGALRKTITKVANIGAQVLVVRGVKDTQCGFKAFRAEVAEDLFARQTITGWSFDVELLGIARQRKYKLATVEIPDWKDPKTVGLVGDSPLKVVFNEAITLFQIRFNLWGGRYRKPNYNHKPQAVNYCQVQPAKAKPKKG